MLRGAPAVPGPEELLDDWIGVFSDDCCGGRGLKKESFDCVSCLEADFILTGRSLAVVLGFGVGGDTGGEEARISQAAPPRALSECMHRALARNARNYTLTRLIISDQRHNFFRVFDAAAHITHITVSHGFVTATAPLVRIGGNRAPSCTHSAATPSFRDLT